MMKKRIIFMLAATMVLTSTPFSALAEENTSAETVAVETPLDENGEEMIPLQDEVLITEQEPEAAEFMEEVPENLTEEISEDSEELEIESAEENEPSEIMPEKEEMSVGEVVSEITEEDPFLEEDGFISEPLGNNWEGLIIFEDLESEKLTLGSSFNLKKETGDRYYSFTPTETGEYVLSVSGSGEGRVEVSVILYVLEEDGTLTWLNDRSGSDIILKTTLEAGKTYCYDIWQGVYNEVNLTVAFETMPIPVALSFGKETVSIIQGEAYYMDVWSEQLAAKVTYSNGGTESLHYYQQEGKYGHIVEFTLYQKNKDGSRGDVVSTYTGINTVGEYLYVASADGVKEAEVSVRVSSPSEIAEVLTNGYSGELQEITGVKYYRFVPEKSGKYMFTFSGTEQMTLQLFSVDENGTSYNLRSYNEDGEQHQIACDLTAGNTYYYSLRGNDHCMLNGTVCFAQTGEVTKIEFEADAIELIRVVGFSFEEINKTTVNVTYSDGKTERLSLNANKGMYGDFVSFKLYRKNEDGTKGEIIWQWEESDEVTAGEYWLIASVNEITAEVPVTVKDIGDVAEELTIGTQYSLVSLPGVYYFRFIPSEDRVYILSSSGSENEDIDANAYLYAVDDEGIIWEKTTSEPYENGGFQLEETLKAGETYYYAVCSDTDEQVSYTMTFETPMPEKVEFETDVLKVVQGDLWWDNRLAVNITYSNGYSERLTKRDLEEYEWFGRPAGRYGDDILFELYQKNDDGSKGEAVSLDSGMVTVGEYLITVIVRNRRAEIPVTVEAAEELKNSVTPVELAENDVKVYRFQPSIDHQYQLEFIPENEESDEIFGILILSELVYSETGAETVRLGDCDFLETRNLIKTLKAGHTYLIAIKGIYGGLNGDMSVQQIHRGVSDGQLVKATLTENGLTAGSHCEWCGEILEKQKVIYYPKTITLSKTSYTYNGKVQKPSVKVIDSAGKTISSQYYTVSYSSGCKNAGSYTVTVSFKGNYSGSKKLTYKITKASQTITASGKTKTRGAPLFSLGAKCTSGGKLTYKSGNTRIATVSSKGNILVKSVGTTTITITAAATTNYNGATKKITIKVLPKGTSLSGLSNSVAGRLAVAWRRNTTVDGYQVQYGIKSSFSGAKTYTVFGNSRILAYFNGMVKGKTYYVRVRTFKKVSGTYYYSSWSAAKSLKIVK